MKMTKKTFLVLSLAACAFAADAEKMPYEPYETIIERQMFGPLPDDFDPTKLPSEVSKSSSSRGGKTGEELTKEEQQLKSAINFSMINVTPDGEVKVGFTDNSDKQTPRNYYMGVGEELDGWLVKEANPSNATMTVVKGEIEVTLKVGGDSAKSDGATARAGSSKANAGRSSLLGGGKPRLSNKQQRAKLMADNAEMRQKMLEMQEEQKRREEEEERRKKDLEENRESIMSELNQLKANLAADRAKAEAAKKDDEENNDEGGEEHANDDAE